jgi:hypothetical protein
MFRSIRKILLAAALAVPVIASAATTWEDIPGGSKVTTVANVNGGPDFTIEVTQTGLTGYVLPMDYTLSSSSYQSDRTTLVNGYEVFKVDVIVRALTSTPLTWGSDQGWTLNGNYTLQSAFTATNGKPWNGIYEGTVQENIQISSLTGFGITEIDRTFDFTRGFWSHSGSLEALNLPNEFRLTHTFMMLSPDTSLQGQLGQYFSLNYSWGTTANFQISAVPEPSTYALMLAGLLIVGFSRKRVL